MKGKAKEDKIISTINVIDKKTLGIADAIDKVDAMGQENEVKAAAYVIEEGKERKREEENKKDQLVSDLERANRWKIKDYKQKLVDIMAEVMTKRIELPKDWAWELESNRKGVVLRVRQPDGHLVAWGIAPCHVPDIDLSAAAELCERAETLFNEYEQKKADDIIRQETDAQKIRVD